MLLSFPCQALELKSKLVPPQEHATMTEAPYKRNDQITTIPVVRSFFVWMMCQALDLPATFAPEQRDTTVSRKQFHVHQPVLIVYSDAIFEMCKALKLKAKLVHL
ncbi:hypothetical protein NPIL_653171 [Nephila pilipes]|uniref:Uncharacterized protein n=1 Tax=Nephila pilipes TaxID=299642 RepID=A0A8X6TFQ8_NEPPI|nr:hypothetical protein NPIL_653171 [Nephila pilipes]